MLDGVPGSPVAHEPAEAHASLWHPSTRHVPLLCCRLESGATRLRLHQVMLQIPWEDFAALLAAALRGSQWQSGARTTSPLLAAISQFEPARSDAQQGGTLTAASRALLLEHYAGFGWEATKLWLVPDQDPGVCVLLPDLEQPLQCMPAGSGGIGRGVRLGLGLGLGLGGGLLLAGLAVIGSALYQDRCSDK